MIGDAYFQLRAQVGTALFSLLRLATETGANESVLAALRTAQSGLRESFLFLVLGPSGSGKSTFLNTLFERELCEVGAPEAASRIAVYQYGEVERETPVSTELVIVQRPHGFLRDFTIVDTPGFETMGGASAADLAPHVASADAIFFVVAAGAAPDESWKFLAQLGREALKRTVFVVWQSDRVLPGEAAQAVKRLRQAMLKNLSQACPIFAASSKDTAGRDKLVRWLETEVIFSTARRTRLDDLDRLAEEALRDVADKPRAAEESWHWGDERLRRLRDLLAEKEEQTERQIAGAMWGLAEGFDDLRRHGETMLRERLRLIDLVRGATTWQSEFAHDLETQASASREQRITRLIDGIERELREARSAHQKDCRETFGEEMPGDPPPFPRTEILAAVAREERPLALEAMLLETATRAAGMLRWTAFAAIGSLVIALGALPFLGFVGGPWSLAGSAVLFVLLLAFFLRDQVIATLGVHLTRNRAALLTALEAALRAASRDFYAALARPIDGRLSVHSAERHRHEPLLERIQQLEETFARIAAPLRASVLSPASAEETPDRAE